MTPEPSAPIQTPFPNIHLVPPALPPTRYTRAHTQPNFFFFLFFLSNLCPVSHLNTVCSRIVSFCFEDWSSLLGGGQKKKQEKKHVLEGLDGEAVSVKESCCPVKSCFCVSFQRLCSIIAPVLAHETVPPSDRKAFRDCAALPLLCWLEKLCHCMTGL